MSKKNDAVFDGFDKARSNIRNAVIVMLTLSALFLTAIENSKDTLVEYSIAAESLDRQPEVLNEYKSWVKEKLSTYSASEYEKIFSNVEKSTKFKLVELPTSGKSNLPVTIARKEISTVEGLRYATMPILPREITYWLNELPFKIKQNAEISLFEVNSLSNALENGSFNCSSNKRFWTFCDEKESMDPSNYPSGAQYFKLDTTQGLCIDSEAINTGSLAVACKVISVPNSSISAFLSEKKEKLPLPISSPPSYQQVSEILGDVKTIDDFREKIHRYKSDAQKLQFSSFDFSSNFIVPGSILVVSLIFLQMLSNLKFCNNNLTNENSFFSLSLIHNDLIIAIISWVVVVILMLFYLTSGFVYIDKNAFQVIAFIIASCVLCVAVIVSAKLCFLIRIKACKLTNT
ncbi:hypothetical protein [Colwellia psychrerythraea]|nr:hypothetical protein [Colwellia psychrerythraea]